MSRTHNKRRNAGLLYEFLVRTISQALVEGNQKKSSTALKILRRHFKPGTELHKEFRLINALVRSTVSSESVASSVLGEAKAASRAYDIIALDREKSMLIRSINHHLRDDNFYDQHITEYKAYATAQTLINNWRIAEGNRDISALANYEDQMVKWLVAEKSEPADSSMGDESPGMTRLLMKVMTKKLNEKYSTSLNQEQKSLLKTYIFSTSQSDPSVIQRRLIEIKEGLENSMEGYVSHQNHDSYLMEKIDKVRGQLLSESLNNIDDDTVTRFMLYMRLNSELTSEE